jgi:hypothetical protein
MNEPRHAVEESSSIDRGATLHALPQIMWTTTAKPLNKLLNTKEDFTLVSSLPSLFRHSLIAPPIILATHLTPAKLLPAISTNPQPSSSQQAL